MDLVVPKKYRKEVSMAKYINKDALVTKLEELKSVFVNERDDYEKGYHHGLNAFISFLNTLEVREMDLEKEISEYFVEHSDEFFSDKYKLIAKHFYELGLKATQKRE